jgi:DNA invertase Pin-like site-specific DNA recombinase
MAIYGLIREIGASHDIDAQELAIRRWADEEGVPVAAMVRVHAGARRPDRRLPRLDRDDLLVVSGAAYLGVCLGEMVEIIEALLADGAAVLCIKERLRFDGHNLAQFRLFASYAAIDVEIRARHRHATVRQVTPEPGSEKPPKRRASRLDSHWQEIRYLLEQGVTKKRIAERFSVSRMTLDRWLKSRTVELG